MKQEPQVEKQKKEKAADNRQKKIIAKEKKN